MSNVNMDPDMEVIGMVNGTTEHRKRIEANRKRLRKMAVYQAKRSAWWRAFRSMAVEAGAFAVAGIAVLVAMVQGLIDPIVSIPVFAICMLWTAIRIDRFVRR